ncbi:helix-turn-helix domain-containing protein [Tenacibaculum halocynthiae]|uniref:helix-turn-helix domain-containing protein n=1 Tax=Tenacibaculum halocynthiae TaxID=1254437 RepID=UPI00262A92BE|nr:helix-turn-helix domain-containing protein [uncultured Tenacibaculum sp.]
MGILEQLTIFVSLLAAFAGVMIGFLFLTLKIKNQARNIFLILFLWSLSIDIFNDFLKDKELFNLFSHLSIKLNTYLFIIPSLFLYLVTISKDKKALWWLLLYVPGIFLNLFSYKDSELEEVLYELVYLLINIPLLIISFYKLRKFKERLESYYSYVENKTLSWIKVIMITIVCLHVFMFVCGMLFINEENQFLENSIDFIVTGVTFFIVYWVGYNGFQQIAHVEEVSEIEIPTEIIKGNIKIDESLEDLKYVELCNEIQKEKYFTNPNLTIKLLSELLALKERELSSLINLCAKKNFHHFINQFRITEFKKLINSEKAKQYSILGLAKESGFSSKSTFYKAFKDSESITPSEYKKTLKCPDTCSRTS